MRKCAMRRGIACWPELENNVAEWLEEQRQNCHVVTRNMIRAYALKWAWANPEQGKEFKATVGWCNRFMNRKHLVIRQKTKDLDQKVTNFHKFVIGMRQKYNFPLSNIGNMDETPMNFDMISNRTVERKGVKTVQLRSTDHEKTRFTVVLTCMADGTKLKPLVIFKRITTPKIKFPPGIFIHFHVKGWMDENGVKLWMENVWQRRPGYLRNQHSLLVWDMFHSHVTE